MTGHLVGVDPMTGSIVVLCKGMDGKAVRQVDVLTPSEARHLVAELDRTLAFASNSNTMGGIPVIAAEPEPAQASFDLDTLTEGQDS